MNNPLISVIVPIYNVEKYLDQCISSIASQTYKNIEIILVDDGSPDNCPKMCDDWAKKDERIKVIHKQNGGLVSARKAGILSSTGDYVMNVDSDDYIGEALIEKVAKVIQENDSPDIVAFNHIHFFPDKEKSMNNSHPYGLYKENALQQIRESFLYYKSLPGRNHGGITYNIWSKAIKRELLTPIQLNVPDSISKGEDVAVFLPSLLNCTSIYLCPFNDYYYRANPTSIINSFNKNEFKKQEVLFDYLKQFVNERYENQFNVYFLNAVVNYESKACAHFKKMKDFKAFINSTIKQEIKNAIKKAKVYKPSLKNRVLEFLVKHNYLSLLYLLLK